MNRFLSWVAVRFEYQPRIYLMLIYVIAFAILASSLISSWGFPLDDSYIYQSIARSAGSPAALHPYVPGRLFAGATSLFWAGLQALRFRALPGLDPVLFNLLLSWALFAALGPLLWTLARNDGRPISSCLLIAATPALCGNFLWLGLLGMEHLSFFLLSLVCIQLWYEKNPMRAMLAGAIAGLLVSLRPEAGLLGPLLALTGKYAGRGWADRGRLILLWLCGTISALVCNLAATGSILPSTLKGRSWMWFRGHSPHSFRAVGGFFGQVFRRLPQLFSIHFAAIEIRLTPRDLPYTLTVVILGLLVGLGARSILREKGLRIRLLFLWAALHTCTYLVLLPTTGHGGRYQPELLLLAFPCIFSGLLSVLRWSFPGRQPIQYAILGLAVMLAGFSSLSSWRTISIFGISHIQNTHGAMATWIKRNLPAPTAVGAFDSGLLAYDLYRSITDLGGLVDPGYLAYLTTGRVPAYLKEYGIRYVVLLKAEKPKDNLHFLDGKDALPMSEFCSSPEVWSVAYSFTANAWRCQELYLLAR